MEEAFRGVAILLSMLSTATDKLDGIEWPNNRNVADNFA